MTEHQLLAGLFVRSWLISLGPEYKVAKKPLAKLHKAIRDPLLKESRSKNVDMLMVKFKLDQAILDSWEDFPEEIEVSTVNVVRLFIMQNPEWFEPYKINSKYLEALSRANGPSGVTWDSSTVARSLAKAIKEI